MADDGSDRKPTDQEKRLAEQTLDACRRALSRNPYAVEHYVSAGAAFRVLGQHDAAAAHFGQATTIAPRDVDIRIAFGQELFALRYYKDSVAQFRAALALAPDRADAHHGLGAALLALRQFQEAADHLAAANRLRPGQGITLRKLGVAQSMLERKAEALASFKAALAADPNDDCTTVELASLQVQLGQLADVEAACEAMVEKDPESLSYLYFYAQTVRGRRPKDDEKIAVLEKRATRNPPQPDPIFIHFALAYFYRKRQDIDAVCDHLEKANAAKRAMISYDEKRELDAIAALAKAFPAEAMQRQAGLGDPSEVPVFIVGMPRSGSTLVEQILASHSQVYGGGERNDFAQVTGGSYRRPPQLPFAPQDLTAETLSQFGHRYVERLQALAPQAKRITDKQLGNFLFAGLIAMTLPRAKIIHIRRDPLDTCLSCYATLFLNPMDYTYNLGELGRYYRAYEGLMAHWRQVLPADALLEVHYEDLVANFEPEVRRLLDFCGLEWEARCLEFYKTTRTVETASAMQVRQPLYRSAIGAAAAYAYRLGALTDALKLRRFAPEASATP